MAVDDSEKTVASLMRWAVGGSGNAEVFARVEAHPEFDRAARALAFNMLDVSAKNDALDGVFKDAGRYVAALWAMYAHVTGGLTLPRLKEICAASGLVSPGRARALLLYLRYLGYIESAGRDQNRVARYTPTAPFAATWTAHLCAALEAARILEPAADLVLRRIREPAVLEIFSRFQGEELLAGAQNRLEMNSPYVRIFMNRHAGSQVIMLLATGDAEGRFPSQGAMAFSTAAVAKRFHVSRIHIKRMLDQAEKESFLKRPVDGTIMLEESGRTAIRSMYVMQLAQLLSQAARTLGTLPEVPQRETLPHVPDREISATAVL